MSWMSRAVWLALVFALPMTTSGQESDTSGSEKQPAPGEPGASTDPAGEVERYDRDVSPIVGTEPQDNAVGAEEDTGDVDGAESPDGTLETRTTTDATQLADQMRQLRQDVEARLKALESKLDLQIERIDSLASMTVTANKPVEDADARDAQDMAREAQITQLKAELQQLRETVTRQLDELAATRSGEKTVEAAKVPDPATTSHRLRIHNTTGVEQPLYVNGVQWTVRADEWSSVPIPRGPVTLHRPGLDPLEVSADEIGWQSDERGFFLSYDFDAHQVHQPASE